MVSSAYDTAIVTGGCHGLGRDFARTLARSGYAVVVVYLRDRGEADAVVQEILAANGTALAIRADLTDELDVERLFAETVAVFGGVDVVVHTTLRCSDLVDQQAARQLRRGGSIVTVAGANAITPVLAHELWARGIAVNGLEPGVEQPGTQHDIAHLVALLDRRRREPGD